MLQKLGLKANRFDLHCHTPFSDGTKEVIDLLIDAQKAGLEVISFTDHDTLRVYDYLSDIDPKNWYSGKIINGVEITVDVDGERLEVLAYNFDLEKLKKYKYFQRAYDEKVVNKQIKKLAKKARKMGFVCERVIKNTGRPSIWRPIYDGIMASEKQNAELIKKYGITDPKHFSRVLFSTKGQPFYMKASYAPSIKKIYKVVHRCGGLCIFAHPYNYGKKDIDYLLDKFRTEKVIDGIECGHSSHSNSEIKHLAEYCDKYGLLKTAGSDFHGGERYYENGFINFAFGYLGAKGEPRPIIAKMLGYKFGNTK